MDTIPFDTHAVVKELVAAGFTERQAEAQVQALLRIVHDQLATKRDVVELQKEIAEIRRDIAEVKRDIRESEMRPTIRTGAMLVVAVGILAVLQKLL